MLTDINDFAFRPKVRSSIRRNGVELIACRTLDGLYREVGRYLEVPKGADIARTLASMGYEPQQRSGFWVLEF